MIRITHFEVTYTPPIKLSVICAKKFIHQFLERNTKLFDINLTES